MIDKNDVEFNGMKDLAVEIKNENKENKIKYSTLEKEIKIVEESRKLHKDNINNFKNSQQPKKSLKKKVISWILGASIFAGAAIGGYGFIKDQTVGDGAYNKEIEKRYELCNETLNEKIDDVSGLNNIEINQLRFNEGYNGDVNLDVYFNGNFRNSVEIMHIKCTATFNVLKEYYNNLVNAESENNMIDYLIALNNIFETMEKINYDSIQKIDMLKCEKTEENVNKINELFKLDFEDETIIRQVGFLPYMIENITYEVDEKTKTINYSYKIKGISYCEVKGESWHDLKIPQKGTEDLIFITNYDKKHIQAFERDFTFTSSRTFEDIRFITMEQDAIWGDINMYLDDVKTINDIKIETTYFSKTDVLDNYEIMKNDNFKFKKPDSVDMKNY